MRLNASLPNSNACELKAFKMEYNNGYDNDIKSIDINYLPRYRDDIKKYLERIIIAKRLKN